MNNVMNFTVQGNRLKLLDGFSPAVGDRRYTQIKVQFQGNDWENCEAVSGHFFASAKEIMRTLPRLHENGTAFFDIPLDLHAGQIHFALSGSHGEGSELVTIATNIVTIDVKKGVIALDEIDINQYEELLGIFNAGLSIKADKNSVYTKSELDGMFTVRDGTISQINTELSNKADKDSVYTKNEIDSKGYLTEHQDISGKANKATTLAGYGITDACTKAEVRDNYQKSSYKATKIYRNGSLNNESYPTVKAVIDFVDEEKPSKTSQLENDSGFLTEHQDISGKADKLSIGNENELVSAASAGAMKRSGYTITENENVIADKSNADKLIANARAVAKAIAAAVPTKTSDLTNDSGFLTEHQDISGKADKATTLAGYGITNAYDKDEANRKALQTAENAISGIEYRSPDDYEPEDYGGYLVYDDGANFVVPLANLDEEFGGSGGKDGFSPTATVTKSGGTSTITITDKNGTTTAAVNDGAPGKDGMSAYEIAVAKGEFSGTVEEWLESLKGADGFSPTVETREVGTQGYVVNITDKNGTKTFMVKHGTKGEKGDTYTLTAADKTEIATEAAAKVNVPTKTSQLTNDSGFLTAHQDISNKADKLSIGNENELVSAASTGAMKRSGYTITENENVIADKSNADKFIANARAVAKAINSAIQTAIGGVENGSY